MQGHCSVNSRIFSLPAPRDETIGSCYHIFVLAGMDLATDVVISRTLSSFEKSCLLREIKPPEWNLSLTLKSLTHHPNEPM